LVRQRDFRVQNAAERERRTPVITVDGDCLVVAAEYPLEGARRERIATARQELAVLA